MTEELIRLSAREAVARLMKREISPLDRNFALGEVGQALEHMRENRHFGKITLTVGA